MARKNLSLTGRNLSTDLRLKAGGDLTAPVGLYKYLINSNTTHKNDRNTHSTFNNDILNNNNNNNNNNQTSNCTAVEHVFNG